MYETSWISLLGLACAFAGLALLSFDLLKSKAAEDEGSSSRALESQLEASTRHHIFLLTQHVDAVSNFFAKTQVVVAKRPEYEEILRTHPTLEADDPAKYELIRDALDTSPAGFQRRSAETFLRELARLESVQRIKEALDLNARTSDYITARFEAERQRSARLTRVAKIGVSLAAIGSLAQLVDIFI